MFNTLRKKVLSCAEKGTKLFRKTNKGETMKTPNITPIEKFIYLITKMKEASLNVNQDWVYAFDRSIDTAKSLLDYEQDLLDEKYEEGWDNGVYEMERWINKNKEKR